MTATADLITSAGEGAPILYGKWEGIKVNFTIKYWVEKAGIVDENQLPLDPGDPAEHPENYEYVMSHASTSAEQQLAGTEMTFAAVKAIADKYKEEAGGANVAMPYSAMAFMNPDPATIAGAGDTTIKVYYTRDVFLFTVNTNNAAAYIVHDGLEYESTANPAKYTMYAKYQQEITKTWPRLGEVLGTGTSIPYGRTSTGAGATPHQDFNFFDNAMIWVAKPGMSKTTESLYPSAVCHPQEIVVVYGPNTLVPTYMPVYTEATDAQLAAIMADVAAGAVSPTWTAGVGPMPHTEMDGMYFVPYFLESVTGKFYVLNEGNVASRMYPRGTMGGGSMYTYSWTIMTAARPYYSRTAPMETWWARSPAPPRGLAIPLAVGSWRKNASIPLWRKRRPSWAL